MSTVGEMIRAHKLRKEQDYASSLLAEAMGASGDFSYNRDTGALGYTPGGTMPTKTEAWNNYLRMKGGQAKAQDIVSFNQLYSSAQQMQTQNQIQEIQKLQLQGADAGDIQDLVGQNPQMYNNLLDMITQLENTPDETGQAALMAGQMRGMIPQPEQGLWGQATEFAGDHWGKLLGGGVAGMYGYGKLKEADIGTKGRQFFRGYLKDPVAAKQLDELLESGKYRIKDGKLEQVSSKKVEAKTSTGKTQMKGGKPVMTTKEVWRAVPEKGGLPYLKPVQETFSKSQLRSAKNILKYAGPQGLLSIAGYTAAPVIAEQVGGEKAREGVEDAMSVTMMAQGGHMLLKGPKAPGKLGVGQKILGLGLLGLGGADLSGYLDEPELPTPGQGDAGAALRNIYGD
jgi:hypothetical protein